MRAPVWRRVPICCSIGNCGTAIRSSRAAESCPTVANAILRLSSQLDLMGLAMIFKLGAMPYDMVERSMTTFGEEVVPRIRHVLDRDTVADRTVAAPALHTR